MTRSDNYVSPTIFTDRLILRNPSLNDAFNMFLQRTDAEVNQFVPMTPPKDPSEVETLLRTIIHNTSTGISDYWIITDKQNTYLGSICLWNYNYKSNTAELGFVLIKNAWNHGYATEAIERVITFAMEKLPFTIIEGWTHHQNFAAQHAMQKNGFLRNMEAEKNIDQSSPDADMQIWTLKLIRE